VVEEEICVGSETRLHFIRHTLCIWQESILDEKFSREESGARVFQPTSSEVSSGKRRQVPRKAYEGTIGKLIFEAVILLSAGSRSDDGKVLRAAAQVYGVDADAVTLKVKQDFPAKEKARKATKTEPKPGAKPKRAA
jgi:ParB family chromosome partitioning protein